MKTEDDVSAAQPATTAKKGWRDFTWDDPGEWKHDPVKKLSYCSLPLGEGARGAAGKVLVVKFEPGAEVPPHYHDSDYCSMIVEGSIEITRRTYTTGHMRTVKAGTVYGPLIAGPDGCTVIDFFATGVADPDVTAKNTYV